MVTYVCNTQFRLSLNIVTSNSVFGAFVQCQKPQKKPHLFLLDTAFSSFKLYKLSFVKGALSDNIQDKQNVWYEAGGIHIHHLHPHTLKWFSLTSSEITIG